MTQRFRVSLGSVRTSQDVVRLHDPVGLYDMQKKNSSSRTCIGVGSLPEASKPSILSLVVVVLAKATETSKTRHLYI
jgi:hypothetical protein